MRTERFVFLLAMVALTLNIGCKKKEEEEDEETVTIQPQILRLPVPEETDLRSRFANLVDPLDDTSLMQSFTPTSIRLSISDISIATGAVDDWDGPKSAIYNCEGETSADCMVEVSDLKEFEDALNAEPVAIHPGEYTKIQVGMCKEINGLQLVEVTGTSQLNGVTYRTDTEDGIVAGEAADAEPVTFKFSGCAIQIPLSTPINAELTEEQKAEIEAQAEECEECAPTVEADIGIRLVFDSFNFAAMGNMANDATKQLVANSASRLEDYKFNEDEADCKGDKDGYFICTQRTALYATDDQAPKIERYNIVLTDEEAYDERAAVEAPEATAYTGLVLRSDDSIIAAYTRRSVNEGAKFNRSQKGDENYFGITENEDGSFIFGQGPDGTDISYEAFKRENHSGERTGLGDYLVDYTATKIE
ncbi:MAG: hypothetical protein AB7T49_10520 [Oligoflexales bacterium]